MAIDITNTLNGHEEVLDVLLESNSVVFIDESHLYFVRSSDNGGWMYDIYNVEDCPKDEDGYPLLDEDDEVNSIDGGLCCGTAQDAIEMAIGNQYEWAKRDVELERYCCGNCESEIGEEGDEKNAPETDETEKPFVYIVARSDSVCGVYSIEILESDEELQKEMNYLEKKGAILRVNNEFDDCFFRQFSYDDAKDEDKSCPYIVANTITIRSQKLYHHHRITKTQQDIDELF